MRIECRNLAARWCVIAAITAASAIGIGCVGMDRELARVLAPPRGSTVDRSDSRAAYDLGYQDGSRDYDRDKRADYTRYRGSYDWSTERDFASGYRAGYEQQAQRSASSRRGDLEDDDERGYDSVAAVPSWLVGGFRGWNEFSGAEVGLTVYPNAAVVLVSGDRTRQGVYRDGQVYLRNSGAYAVTRARNGIRFTKAGDERNTSYLRRTD